MTSNPPTSQGDLCRLPLIERIEAWILHVIFCPILNYVERLTGIQTYALAHGGVILLNFTLIACVAFIAYNVGAGNEWLLVGVVLWFAIVSFCLLLKVKDTICRRYLDYLSDSADEEIKIQGKGIRVLRDRKRVWLLFLTTASMLFIHFEWSPFSPTVTAALEHCLAPLIFFYPLQVLSGIRPATQPEKEILRITRIKSRIVYGLIIGFTVLVTVLSASISAVTLAGLCVLICITAVSMWHFDWRADKEHQRQKQHAA